MRTCQGSSAKRVRDIYSLKGHQLQGRGRRLRWNHWRQRLRKSTLLKIIAHILAPTRGRVKVEGKITPFLELGVGFQPDLTSRENVEVYATIMGLPRREIRNKIDDIIEFAGLQKFEDTKLKNLSSGMQVRLAFSTAVQTNPDILLVDEVLAVGDMEFQQKCFDVFNSFKKDGVTILFVSHDLGAVRRFCDKTMLLRGGQMVEFGETSRIIDKYIYNTDGGDKPEAGAETKAEVEEKKTRWGNGKVEITGVKLLDKNGHENSNFVFGDPMTVRVYYKVNEPVSSPVSGSSSTVGIHTATARPTSSAAMTPAF